MEKKQTAMKTLIEWGDKMLQEHPMKILSFAEAIDKAVELLKMEKEQLIDAHIEGQRVFDEHPHTQWTTDQAEQYYNETYRIDDTIHRE
jgi:hypothetical protein